MPANCAVDIEQGLAFFRKPLKVFVIPDSRNPEADLAGGFFTVLRRTACDRRTVFAARRATEMGCGHTEGDRESYQMLARV